MTSNIYNINQRAAWDAFSAHLAGSEAGLLLAISETELSPTARQALDNSAKALGYGKGACTFACVQPASASQDTPGETAAPSLDAHSLKLLVEGIDPLALVASDAAALQLVQQAYPDSTFSPRQANAKRGACWFGSALGRTVVAFERFEGMLGDAGDKQHAWALLKKLPHLD